MGLNNSSKTQQEKLKIRSSQQQSVLTRKEQKNINETKYGIAILIPHVLVPRLLDSGSHSLPSMHASMICCQLSPVAHLTQTDNQPIKLTSKSSDMHRDHAEILEVHVYVEVFPYLLCSGSQWRKFTRKTSAAKPKHIFGEGAVAPLSLVATCL